MELRFDNLHHAYLLLGNQIEAEAFVHALFEKAGKPLKGSPDFFVLKDETFGIDAARSLAVQSMRKAFGEKKVFFIAPETMTLEAQNALLKTFEEPSAGTHFFLALRDDGMVIPTLRSRMQEMRLDAPGEEGADAKKFLSLATKDRMTFIKKFVDAEKNLSAFLDDMLAILREQKKASACEEVFKMRLVSDQRGAASRLILEHLATIL